MGKMPKVPKNRSDKEMMAGFVEEETLEDRFHKAAKVEEERKAAEKAAKTLEPDTPADLLRGGFTKDLTNDLGKALMELKLQLASEGITKYTFKITREGEKIILTPKHG